MAKTTPTPPTTRLAPSPTGALHLGNALTFLANWALARRRGWRIVLRVEDLDGPRVKPGSDTQAIALLQWLGIDWDTGPIYQSADLQPYRSALERLRAGGRIYPCKATRKQIEQSWSAPHDPGHELRYPGPAAVEAAHQAAGETPIHVTAPPDKQDVLAENDYAWRLRVPDQDIGFDDTLHGRCQINVQQTIGDFVLATKAGLPAYQLAVVVDDARQGVSHVVRGDDLLSSTARQVLLYQYLGLGSPPTYTHLPLVYGPDGLRLAKRHGDTRLLNYREQGVPSERIIGLLAYHARCVAEPTPMTACEFAQRLDPDRLYREPVCFSKEDDAWLLSKPA